MTGSEDLILKQFFSDIEEYNSVEYSFNRVNYLLTNELNEDSKLINNSYLNLDESYASTEGAMMDELNDSNDEKHIQTTLREIFNQDSSMYAVLSDKNFTIASLDCYLKVMFIWGIGDSGTTTHPILQTWHRLSSLTQALKTLDRKISRNKEDLKYFTGKLYKTFSGLKSWFFEMNISKSEETVDEAFYIKRDLTKIGTILPVRCGHNGVPNGHESS
eukprot:CAMPEP_0170537660 /NCGR_PEP_ID=MMETSP0209-20121228/102846_1 /TAXON_ID=665100 ORGANISM="Litonotus pictus, Strain P1" /NCGR_SAMPLE_ID=MMETSP0209 /ASSEMBLY_ACC=CAM_ASM_000301 /LENGTH=216 /DNA_ID=CAMNT_0010839199 /DNA_START=1350 /DNA_END=1996 /DNA_ORIENTATION=+